MKAAIYLFSEKYEYILAYMPALRPGLTVTSIVAPAAYKNTDRLAEGIKIYQMLEDVIDDVESVIFMPMDNTELLYQQMRMCAERKKHVICGAPLAQVQADDLRRICTQNGTLFSYFDDDAGVRELEIRGDPYTEQESVVIAVTSLTADINTSQFVMELWRELKDRQYRVEVIGTAPELSVLGIEQLPIDRMIQDNLNHTVLSINRFFNYFQLRNRPSVIILQLPCEGLYRDSKTSITCFGAKTYLISQAVAVDYCTVFVPQPDMGPDAYRAISDETHSRFGFGFNSICRLPILVDTISSPDKTKMHYFEIPGGDTQEDIEEIQKGDGEKMILLDKQRGLAGLIADDIISCLS